jgi:uncharacterized protein (DUF2249 family)
MQSKIITLDARAAFRSGEHPCDEIQNALSRVSATEALRLLVPFEPIPLLEVARTKGLRHESKQTANGDWEVLFSRDAATINKASEPTHSCGCGCSASGESIEIVDVDARGLEPPQPMVKILEALNQLPSNAGLNARTDRRPIHLYPILNARGFNGESEEQSDGSFITHIRRA